MIDYLSKTLGKPNDSISSLLFKLDDDGKPTSDLSETALADLETLHAEHIKGSGEDELKVEYDKGHKQGKFEALSVAEESLRKKFGVEGKKLEDIVQAAVTNAAKAEGTEDKVLIHPLYTSLKADSEAAIEALKSEYEAKIQGIETQAAKRERFSKAMPIIEAAMQDAGVVMPKNPTAAAKVKAAFLSEFDGFDFDETETGIYLKSEDGKLKKDLHGHPITLDSFTKQKSAEWFEIEKQPGRKTPGNDPNDPPPPTKWTKDNLPGSHTAFEEAYSKITDPKERTEFVSAYQAANAPAD